MPIYNPSPKELTKLKADLDEARKAAKRLYDLWYVAAAQDFPDADPDDLLEQYPWILDVEL